MSLKKQISISDYFQSITFCSKTHEVVQRIKLKVVSNSDNGQIKSILAASMTDKIYLPSSSVSLLSG